MLGWKKHGVHNFTFGASVALMLGLGVGVGCFTPTPADSPWSVPCAVVDVGPDHDDDPDPATVGSLVGRGPVDAAQVRHSTKPN